MALEMWFISEHGKVEQTISHGQLDILQLTENTSNFPMLNWLFDNFYNDPVIYPNISNSLANEIQALANDFTSKNRKQYLPSCQVLNEFFGKAFAENQVIYTISD